MRYFSHAVIYRGVVYYGMMVGMENGHPLLTPYKGECEATVFINGVILVLPTAFMESSVMDDLAEIASDALGVEELIDALRLYVDAHDWNTGTEEEYNRYCLISVSSRAHILS